MARKYARLLKLAAHLRTVLRKNFSIHVYRCGTVACAIGHACNIPSFKRAGLRMSSDSDLAVPKVVGHENDDFFGLPAFFNISRGEAWSLFMTTGYKPRNGYSFSHITPKVVARKIEQLVARKLRKAA